MTTRTMPMIISHMNAESTRKDGLKETFPFFMKSMNAAPTSRQIPMNAKMPQTNEMNDATPTTTNMNATIINSFRTGPETTASLFIKNFLLMFFLFSILFIKSDIRKPSQQTYSQLNIRNDCQPSLKDSILRSL